MRPMPAPTTGAPHEALSATPKLRDAISTTGTRRGRGPGGETRCSAPCPNDSRGLLHLRGVPRLGCAEMAEMTPAQNPLRRRRSSAIATPASGGPCRRVVAVDPEARVTGYATAATQAADAQHRPPASSSATLAERASYPHEDHLRESGSGGPPRARMHWRPNLCTAARRALRLRARTGEASSTSRAQQVAPLRLTCGAWPRRG